MTTATPQTGYYVTVQRDGKTGWLFGPIADHDVAKQLVPAVRALACRIDPWCDFDAFGTSSITTTGTLPVGKLNGHFK
jgi:hypothetical protein